MSKKDTMQTSRRAEIHPQLLTINLNKGKTALAVAAFVRAIKNPNTNINCLKIVSKDDYNQIIEFLDLLEKSQFLNEGYNTIKCLVMESDIPVKYDNCISDLAKSIFKECEEFQMAGDITQTEEVLFPQNSPKKVGDFPKEPLLLRRTDSELPR